MLERVSMAPLVPRFGTGSMSLGFGRVMLIDGVAGGGGARGSAATTVLGGGVQVLAGAGIGSPAAGPGVSTAVSLS